jgi:hypothetical protein
LGGARIEPVSTEKSALRVQRRLTSQVGVQNGRAFLDLAGWTFRGALYYKTASVKLAHVNELTGIFEYETDRDGDVTSKAWEWK